MEGPGDVADWVYGGVCGHSQSQEEEVMQCYCISDLMLLVDTAGKFLGMNSILGVWEGINCLVFGLVLVYSCWTRGEVCPLGEWRSSLHDDDDDDALNGRW